MQKLKIKDLFNPISNPSGGVTAAMLSVPGSKDNKNLSNIFNSVSPAWKSYGSTRMIDSGGNIAPKPIMSQPVAPVVPTRPSGGGGSPSPVGQPIVPPVTPTQSAVAPVATPTIPNQYKNTDGSMKTPEQVAAEIAETLKTNNEQGDVGKLFASDMAGGKTAEELRVEATNLNNIRNDIAVGETDPYGVGAKSGIAWTPEQLSAIEKAQAGIYDPALNTVFTKLEAKQQEDIAKQQTEAARVKAEAERNAPFTLSKDQVRYDSNGNIIAVGSSSSPEFSDTKYTLGSNPTVDSWVNMISSKRASIENAPQEIRGMIAQGLDQMPNPQAGYIIQQADEAIRSIDTIFNKISGETSGFLNTAANPVSRSIASWIPGSDSRDVEAARTALEAIVGFDTLNKMREAAPSGASGLGQITEKELKFLQSVQGSLDTLQSNEQLFETLKKVQRSFKVLKAASSAQTGIPESPNNGDVWKAPDNSIYEFVDGAWDEIESAPQTFRSVGNTTVSIPESSRLAYINNNPGNLRFAGQPGAVQGEGGFARFNSPEEGAQALARQVQLDSSRGLTLTQFISKYAPPNENDTDKYISDMVAMTGASPSTPISNIDLNTLVKAIARKESSTNIG